MIIKIHLFLVIFAILWGCSSKDRTIQNNESSSALNQSSGVVESQPTSSGNSSAESSSNNITNDLVFISDFSQINEIMNLSMEEVLERLGSDYELVDAFVGDTAENDGFYYADFGITVVFDSDFDSISYIKCYEIVDVMGVNVGMTFTEIENVLGKGERQYFDLEYPPNFTLSYKYDNCIVRFSTDTEEGASTDLEIRNSDLFSF